MPDVATGRSVAERYPHLVAQWHPSNALGPHEVSYGSNIIVRWHNCPVDARHEWTASVKTRTRMGQGCSVCRGTQVMPGVNDLASLRPDLAAEWSSRNAASASEVSARSGKAAEWVHIVDGSEHAWSAPPDRRAAGRGCPVCAGQRVLPGVNDLATLAPSQLAEWDYERNGHGPEAYTVRSGVRVAWKCALGHTWHATIASRTAARPSGCPACRFGERSSAPEQCMRDLLYRADDWLFERHPRTVELLWGKGSSVAHVDALGEPVFAGPGLVVEYDGCYYHSGLGKRRSDIEKTEALVNAGLLVARIREQSPAIQLRPFMEDEPRVLMVDVDSKQWESQLDGAIQRVIDWACSLGESPPPPRAVRV